MHTDFQPAFRRSDTRTLRRTLHLLFTKINLIFICVKRDWVVGWEEGTVTSQNAWCIEDGIMKLSRN